MGEASNKPGGLEMGHDPEHEKTEWHIQRIGWALILLLCIAALAGALGDGPAANTQQGKVGEELYLEYDRYVRHQAPFMVKIFCQPEQSNDFSLSFTRSFLKKHEVKEIQPEPESSEISSDRCTYRHPGARREHQHHSHCGGEIISNDSITALSKFRLNT